MDIKELKSFKLADAIKFRNKLNPKLWTKDNQLIPEVREQLLIIAEDFMSELGIKDPHIEDITISGSNAAYSYTAHSDLDLHLVIDMSKLPDSEVYQELFNAKKTLYNDAHNIKIHRIPVELYVQDSNQPVVSLGEYSVLHDRWIQHPIKRRANLDQNATRAKFDKLSELVDLALESQNLEKINKVIHMIRRYRQAGLSSGGEFGPENLAFKAIRTHKGIDKLYNMRNKLRSAELSIKEAGLAEEESDGLDVDLREQFANFNTKVHSSQITKYAPYIGENWATGELERLNNLNGTIPLREWVSIVEEIAPGATVPITNVNKLTEHDELLYQIKSLEKFHKHQPMVGQSYIPIAITLNESKIQVKTNLGFSLLVKKTADTMMFEDNGIQTNYRYNINRNRTYSTVLNIQTIDEYEQVREKLSAYISKVLPPLKKQALPESFIPKSHSFKYFALTPPSKFHNEMEEFSYMLTLKPEWREKIELVESIHEKYHSGVTIKEEIDPELQRQIEATIRSYTTKNPVIGNKYIPVEISLHHNVVQFYDVFRNSPPKKDATFGILTGISNNDVTIKIEDQQYIYPLPTHRKIFYTGVILLDSIEKYESLSAYVSYAYGNILPLMAGTREPDQLNELRSQEVIHTNPSTSTLKALARNNKYGSARFTVTKDGTLKAADSAAFTHQDISPDYMNVKIRGYIVKLDPGQGEGNYIYQAWGPYDHIPVDDPIFRHFEKAGIENGNHDLKSNYLELEESANDTLMTIYRGEYVGNKNGNFWTEDREFARQFTQSGQDKEILTRYIHAKDIYQESASVYAGDPDAIDIEVATAKKKGYKAVLLDEGPGEPNSIYVFDKSALMRSNSLNESQKSDPVYTIGQQIQDTVGLQQFITYESYNGDIILSSIIVGRENQGKGLGTEAMKMLCDYADKTGKRIVLSPGEKDDRHGTTSRGRLVQFYKRFGFIESKGRNIDYIIGAGKMYRNSRISKNSENTMNKEEINEIGFADALDNLKLPNSEIIDNSIVSGTIGQKPVRVFNHGTNTLYFFSTETDILALVLLDRGHLKAIKNFTSEKGMIYSLLNYIVNFEGIQIKIAPTEPFTAEGFDWLVRLASNTHGLRLTTDTGDKIDIEQLKQEWNNSKLTKEPGLSGLVISEMSKEWKTRLIENEDSLMPFVIFEFSECLSEASGYIPSEKQKNDPRWKTALTKDVRPGTMKKNARAFGNIISRAGIPPSANPNGKF